MSGKIITVAQQKGGAGKTTLAAQLAAALQKSGVSVATIDIDPQGSLTLWYTARMHSMGEKNDIIHAQVQGWRLKKETDRLAAECYYVIIDVPPHAESETATAMRLADLVLVPLQLSPMDFWASRPTLKTARDEKTESLIVLNRVAPRTKLNAQISEKLDALETPVASQTLGNRVAYAASMLDGYGVVETEPSGVASKEMQALVKELKTYFSKKSQKAA
mgnify:CR=1 FL=1